MVDFAEILEGEALAVACWRFRELLRIGVNDDDAERLALGDADIRRLEAIVDAGCPAYLAVAIIA